MRNLMTAAVATMFAMFMAGISAQAKISAMSGAYDGKPQTRSDAAKPTSPKPSPRKNHRRNRR